MILCQQSASGSVAQTINLTSQLRFFAITSIIRATNHESWHNFIVNLSGRVKSSRMADPNTGLNNSPGPKTTSVTGMGHSEEFSLRDQIELDKYNRANAAAKSGSSFFGIRRVKFIPTGTVYPTGNNNCY